MTLYGILHAGSGLGNMLHRYVGTRVLALDSGRDFGMVAPELFKGKDFMNLDMGKTGIEYHIETPAGKVIPHTTEMVVDGEMQGSQYFIHRLGEVREWLKVEPLDLPYDLCIIGFRGGEYVGVKDLFLPQSYWDEAISRMREINPQMKFEVHTDDVETAMQFFPFECIHDIGLNWRSVRYANYLIIANSSFFIFPALLGNAQIIIAPLHWAGHNKGVWQLEDNNYTRFTYI